MSTRVEYFRFQSRRREARELALDLERRLQPGDVLFTALANPLGRQIAQASATWIAHVGIAFHEPGRGWVVADSGVPLSRCGSLEDFIRRGDAKVSVRRLARGLSAQELLRLRAAAQERLGRLYHTGFKYESSRQFCSKFVYEIFREALDVEIGHLQSFDELLHGNPKANLHFWKWWYFGRIPWQRLTITPASQYESPLLAPVYERLQ